MYSIFSSDNIRMSINMTLLLKCLGTDEMVLGLMNQSLDSQAAETHPLYFKHFNQIIHSFSLSTWAYSSNNQTGI